MNTQNVNPQTIGQFQLKRPASIMGYAKQIVIFLRDVSGSVRGHKAEEIWAASLALVAELAQPVNRGGFLIGIIDFADSARWAHPITPANDLNGRIQGLTVGGRTNLTAALKLALDELMSEMNQEDLSPKTARPVVITLSDGEHNTGATPEKVAVDLCRIADHITVGFGSDYDRRLLTAIATSAQHHYRIKDSGKELRMFLAQVGVTLTKTLTQQMDATTALGRMQST